MFEDTYGNLAQPPLQLTKKEKFVTLKEYVLWEAKKHEKYEYHHGKIVKMPYARFPHNEISTNIIGAFKIAFKSLSKKYRIASSDQKIYIPTVNHGVYADALVVSEEPKFWDDDNLLLINPLLIVEVLSPSTQAFDRNGKFDLYKNLPSFTEYLLVRQDTCEIETRFREEPNLWRETVQKDLNGMVHLRSIGCDIPLADIYENIEFPPPKTKK
ncbi:MAG: Uma2 family endonuclease [Saprospiraceae bacterium]|nr:Uma2 family endonuclease [Saprospiraceae bacterium]